MRTRPLLGQRLLCAVAARELHLKGGGFPAAPWRGPGVSPGGEDATRLLPPRPGAETSTRLRRLLQPRAPCPPRVQGQRGQRGQQTRQQGERGASGAVGGTGPPRPHRRGGGSQRDGMPPPLEGGSGGPRAALAVPCGCGTRRRARLRSRVAVDVCVGPVVWLGRGRLQHRARGHLGARCGESTVNRPTLWPTGSPGVAVSARARGDCFCKDMGPARHLGVGRFFLRSRGAACEAVFGKCEDPEGRPSWQGSRLG